MRIKVLGPGCKNCQALEARTLEALASLGVAAEVEKVTDYGEIAGFGVMKTPGLVVDDAVVVSGRVPTISELRELLATRTGAPSGR
jgi:small redox-active disulfide protein 2